MKKRNFNMNVTTEWCPSSDADQRLRRVYDLLLRDNTNKPEGKLTILEMLLRGLRAPNQQD